jgi:hypothetical protein
MLIHRAKSYAFANDKHLQMSCGTIDSTVRKKKINYFSSQKQQKNHNIQN